MGTPMEINKFCHHCQVKGKAPQRFKFSLKDPDMDFNYEVITDIMYLDGKPVLHQCWIDIYLGPPDVLSHDAGTNFDSVKFRNKARLAGIICNQVPVEAHWSIGKIISEEVQGLKEARLQMAVKAVNDTANPDGLVPTLLAVQKAMIEVKKVKAQRTIRDAINTRNEPNTLKTLPMSLPIGSSVLVYREKGGWEGPHKVIAVTDKDVTIASSALGGTSTFRSTHVKPYEQPKGSLEVHLPPPPPQFDPNEYKVIPDEDLDIFVMSTAYVSTKEKNDHALALKLRSDGKIVAPGRPYEASDMKELDALFADGILQPEMYDEALHRGATIFKSRMVREVKGKNTPAPYEKSRLVQGMKVMIRDITMAYTQSKTPMQRTIYVRLPSELKSKYPEGTLLRVVKPLHHQKELGMTPSAFDPCLLIAEPNRPFGITGLQTDDTLNIGTTEFLAEEDKALARAGIKAKPQKVLEPGAVEDFNGSRIVVHERTISAIQKGQAERLEELDLKAPDMIKRFTEQRARGAYIASICQPEAAFDYSTAAQHTKPGPKEAKALNARIKWQVDHKDRGLRYVELDPQDLRLYVFVDGSFANNKDMSSQIGYIVVLGNERPTDHDNEVRLTGNIIHWSSTKCKRVTRSVLASEIYGMVQGFDVGYVIHNTINTILSRLSLPMIPLVLCTDSFSLYQCLVQMGSTNEKRLMIDLMALRQSCNPADAMTKASPNEAMRTLVEDNQIDLRLEGWVKRGEIGSDIEPAQ
ncbi:hypothetical protein F4813DRAFT_383489 [Daldinia decipiens]|uniref:uncharacterized protein n=1 Tax=Daldinia decipiens TaxID=326647 RepID=UPI0020C41F02|nr:uncharacterized protein F4813DRAFT_383489 [Daldinia decipiens]KAI1653193.1 hypothetical protein F4813DRAFT_383489 [Daldinia decipiens]